MKERMKIYSTAEIGKEWFVNFSQTISSQSIKVK